MPSLQINGHGRQRFLLQRIDSLISPGLLGLRAQRYLAVGLERHDKILLERGFDLPHVLGWGKPDVIEHIRGTSP